jgi:hypothetical protein
MRGDWTMTPLEMALFIAAAMFMASGFLLASS